MKFCHSFSILFLNVFLKFYVNQIVRLMVMKVFLGHSFGWLKFKIRRVFVILQHLLLDWSKNWWQLFGLRILHTSQYLKKLNGLAKKNYYRNINIWVGEGWSQYPNNLKAFSFKLVTWFSSKFVCLLIASGLRCE